MGTAPAFASVSEAMDMVQAGLSYLAAADAAQLAAETQAECLRGLEQADAAGLDLRDLGAMFAEMYERARSELPDEDPDRDFEDRALRLVTTFQGAGVLNGDLTPECAAAVTAVLDALSAPAGTEDTRTR